MSPLVENSEYIWTGQTMQSKLRIHLKVQYYASTVPIKPWTKEKTLSSLHKKENRIWKIETLIGKLECGICATFTVTVTDTSFYSSNDMYSNLLTCLPYKVRCSLCPTMIVNDRITVYCTYMLQSPLSPAQDLADPFDIGFLFFCSSKSLACLAILAASFLAAI